MDQVLDLLVVDLKELAGDPEGGGCAALLDAAKDVPGAHVWTRGRGVRTCSGGCKWLQVVASGPVVVFNSSCRPACAACGGPPPHCFP